jgi:hypothetical protein
MMFFECEDCKFATNSRKQSNKHEESTDHTMVLFIDYEEAT